MRDEDLPNLYELVQRVNVISIEELNRLRRSATARSRIYDAKRLNIEEFIIILLRNATLEHMSFITELLRNASNVSGFRNECGRNLMHIAAKENANAIPGLIDMGCDVIARDRVFSNTPLHIASIYGNMNAIFHLIQHGAGINLRNDTKETPLDIFLSLCRSDMGERIKKRRLAIAHTLARMGFTLTPREKSRRKNTFRNTIFQAFHQQKRCNSVLSLQHICRLNIRETLPSDTLVESVRTLPIPKPLHDYLLYRPDVLDRHVLCPHTTKELLPVDE